MARPPTGAYAWNSKVNVAVEKGAIVVDSGDTLNGHLSDPCTPLGQTVQLGISEKMSSVSLCCEPTTIREASFRGTFANRHSTGAGRLPPFAMTIVCEELDPTWMPGVIQFSLHGTSDHGDTPTLVLHILLLHAFRDLVLLCSLLVLGSSIGLF
jgi:hypothetical protein